MEWLANNYTWLFDGFAGAVVIGVVGYFLKRKLGKGNSEQVTPSQNIQSVNIHLGKESLLVNDASRLVSHVDPKAAVSVLFVDDQKFDHVSVLKRAGWTNTKSIKNISRIDCSEVANADVLFIDINGVATDLFPKEQGLGAAVKIKEAYPDKYVVVYSAQPQLLSDSLSKVDGVLPKDADPYQYTNILENYLESNVI